MANKILIVLFVLFTGCAPSFTVDICVDSCQQCGLPACDQICADLDRGMASETCSEVSSNVWNCAVSARCGFADQCEVEIGEFFACE